MKLNFENFQLHQDIIFLELMQKSLPQALASPFRLFNSAHFPPSYSVIHKHNIMQLVHF